MKFVTSEVFNDEEAEIRAKIKKVVDGIEYDATKIFATIASALPLRPSAASPYIGHDLMETDDAGKDQERATRNAGSSRPQYPARNRDQASA